MAYENPSNSFDGYLEVFEFLLMDVVMLTCLKDSCRRIRNSLRMASGVLEEETPRVVFRELIRFGVLGSYYLGLVIFQRLVYGEAMLSIVTRFLHYSVVNLLLDSFRLGFTSPVQKASERIRRMSRKLESTPWCRSKSLEALLSSQDRLHSFLRRLNAEFSLPLLAVLAFNFGQSVLILNYNLLFGIRESTLYSVFVMLWIIPHCYEIWSITSSCMEAVTQVNSPNSKIINVYVMSV
jgi:hypothetical protein